MSRRNTQTVFFRIQALKNLSSLIMKLKNPLQQGYYLHQIQIVGLQLNEYNQQLMSQVPTLSLAQEHFNQGNYGLAKQVLQSDAELESPERYRLMAAIFHRMGDLRSALSYSCLALEVGPDSIEAKTQMGIVLYKMRRFDEAIDCFQVAYKAEPRNLSHCMGRVEQAETCHRRALESEDANPGCRKLLNKLCRKIKTKQKQIEHRRQKERLQNQGRQDKIEAVQDENMCVFCQAERPQYAGANCGHFCVCSNCVESMTICPICRNQTKFMRIYLV